MRKTLIFATSLIVLHMGCDSAARQQQAKEARKQQTVQDLQELGEEMQNNNQVSE